jgi:LmbE family N-acetylglucosaminyl deacetylase
MSSASDLPPQLTRPARHLFLSPHYDDIPLSVGATVRLLADHGLTPETLIVFGTEPDRAHPLSEFAEAMHEQWGLTANEVVASRQAEEAAAAAVLGANTRVLPFSRCYLPRRPLPVERRSLRFSGYGGGVPARRDRRIARSRGFSR